jgi:hypothetical protein
MKPFLVVLLSLFFSTIQAWIPSQQRKHHQHLTTLPMAASTCWANEQGKELVDRFGSIWEGEVEKVYAFKSLKISESQDGILDAVLLCIKDAESSALGRRRWWIRLPSRRATMGCYGRILAEMNSGRLVMMEGREETDAEEDLDVKYRRNVLLLLEALSTHPKGVWSLEGEMIQKMGAENFGAGYGKMH